MGGNTSSNGASGGLDREAIIDATERCVRAWGYEATTIRAIAGELDCAVGSIYRYFDDKRALIAVVAERLLEPAAERAEQGASLREAARAYAEGAAREGELYRLLFYLSAVGPDGARRLPRGVDRLIEAWAYRMGDRTRAGRAWAALHGAVLLGWAVDAAVSEALDVPSAEASPSAGQAPAGKNPDEVWLL